MPAKKKRPPSSANSRDVVDPLETTLAVTSATHKRMAEEWARKSANMQGYVNRANEIFDEKVATPVANHILAHGPEYLDMFGQYVYNRWWRDEGVADTNPRPWGPWEMMRNGIAYDQRDALQLVDYG